MKQLSVRLHAELDDQKNTLKNLKIKEPSDLVLDFINLSINESEYEGESARELPYDNTDTLCNLFDELKRSKKSMPDANTFADQPRLMNGLLTSDLQCIQICN